MVFCMNINESHQMKVKYVIQHVIRELNNHACIHEHLHNVRTLCMTLGSLLAPLSLRHIWLELLGSELHVQLKGSGPRM